MRNRVERALAQGRSEPDYREALHATIEEADQLIRTFNALLLIARVEAGVLGRRVRPTSTRRSVARDVVELYEPVAEEAGVDLQARRRPAR